MLIAVTSLSVVRTREVTSQVLVSTFYGLLLAVMFFVFKAPDVALSQIAVGTVALPLMVAGLSVCARDDRSGLVLCLGYCLGPFAFDQRPNAVWKGQAAAIHRLVVASGGRFACGAAAFSISLGEKLIEEASHSHAPGVWISWMYLVTGTLTSAPVFRAFLLVFMGLGDRGLLTAPLEWTRIRKMTMACT